MNGAVPKADFVRGQNRLIGGNHVKKNSWFRDADVGNTAVGMQKGKTLFTTQHQVAPQPTVDQVTPARQIGDKLAYGTIDALSEGLGTKHATDVTPKPSDTFTTNIKDYPLNTRSRALEYERRGWAQDHTTRLPDGKVPARQIGGRQLTDAISTINTITQDKPSKGKEIWQGVKQSFKDDWDTSLLASLVDPRKSIGSKLLRKGWEKITNK